MDKTTQGVNQAIFQGFFGVIPENRAIPTALSTSEIEAIKYAKGANNAIHLMDLALK
jgi:hypothetical protein